MAAAWPEIHKQRSEVQVRQWGISATGESEAIWEGAERPRRLIRRGNAWVTSQGENAIYAINPSGTVIGMFGGGGVGGPWGATVDGDDNVWVSNFGPLMPGSNWTNGRISKLCGFKPGACPPGMHPGQPISPWTGYTVPSAKSQVLLAQRNTALRARYPEPTELLAADATHQFAD